MKRRSFLQNTATILVGAGLSSTTKAEARHPLKKAFKVRALETRYKDKISYAGIPLDFKLLSSDTEDRLSIFISSNNRKGFGPPLHVHYTFDEFFTVLEGTFEYKLNDELLTLTTGDTLFIPRHVKHAFQCVSEKPGTLLVAMIPGKGMEAYFADMAKLLNVQGSPDMKALQALFKKYNSGIVGPPMQ